MAMNIVDLIKVEGNGLLSKIKIGNTTYELKDLVAREGVESLADLIDALSAKVGNVEEGKNLADIIKNIQENAYDDSELRELIDALEEAVGKKADAEQVAKDIKDEADRAKDAEKALADDIDAINAVLNTVDSEDTITSLKELAIWVEEHGEDAAEMTKAIEANAKAIQDEAKARGDEDAAIDGRLDAIEAILGEGEGSVSDQIADALAEAKGYTDDREDAIEEAYKAADKVITDSLGALAHKDSATGKVAGETISGVKATGTGVTGVTLSDTANTKDITSAGTFTPAGTVAGNVVIAEHAVPVAITNNDAQAVVTTGTGVANATVTVTPSVAQFVSSITAGSLPTFTAGAFDAGKLDTEDVTIAAHKELSAEVNGETLEFTSAMIDAISFKAVSNYVAPSKAADTFNAGSQCTAQYANVVTGIDSASASVNYEKVTGVTYQKAEENATGTCAGSTVAINATFTGTEGNVSVNGQYTDTTYTAAANTGNIELAVGDIAVAAKDVTVQ